MTPGAEFGGARPGVGVAKKGLESAACAKRDVMRSAGMMLPGNGAPVRGSIGRQSLLFFRAVWHSAVPNAGTGSFEKSPFKTAGLGTESRMVPPEVTLQ